MTAMDLPAIDLHLLDGDDAQRASAVAAIDAACTSLGFFTVTGHGIDPALLDAVLDRARAFFALPLEEKMAVHIGRSPVHRGYAPVAAEQLQEDLPGDRKETFDMGPDLGPDHPEVRAGTPLHGPTQWPVLPGFREAMLAYDAAARRAAALVLRGLALALDLDDEFFARSMQEPMVNLRIIHYPPGARVSAADAADAALGCGAHADYGSVTLLADDGVGGLEVRTRDGVWRSVSIPSGSLVVNLGDMLARWTNDRYVSTLHRVINPPDRDRYSVPLFVNPDFRTPVACLPSCTGPRNPPRYPPTTAGDYLLSRFDATHDYRRTS